MSLVTFAPTEAMQVTLRPRVYKVDIGKVGFQGPQGTPGTAAATSYTYAGLPSASPSGQIANVSDNIEGFFRSNGDTWQKVGGKVVHAEDFGVVYSTPASPVDVAQEWALAIDALDGLPGEVHINPPPAINTSGVGYGLFLHVSEPIILSQGQAIVAVGGQPGPVGPNSGDGVSFRAMDGFTGVAVIMGNSWFSDPVNDYDHGVRVHGVSIECRSVAANGFAFNQLGEASMLSFCNVWRATESAYKLTGVHASGVLFECSGWECPYVVKTTSHPDEADTLTGGQVRTFGLSGDDNGAVFYVDGALHLTAVGTKSEATPIGVEVASVTGTGTGGAAAILNFFGGSFADPDTGDTFAKVTGAIARPIIALRGTFLTGYPNLIEDAVRSVTRVITGVPGANFAFLVADWIYGGSSEFGSGGEVVFPDGFKMSRPSTGFLYNVMQFQSNDRLHIISPLVNGTQIDDSTGAVIAKFRSQPAGGVEFSTWLRWDVDNTNDIGQDTLRPRNLNMGGYVQATEIADPTAPAANTGRLYFKDNGSGKTQLAVRFPTGAVQVIATEP